MTRAARRGAAAIEFALALPILVVVFAGVVDLAAYVSTAHRVMRAARDGARTGAGTLEGASPTGSEIEAAAVAQARTLLRETSLPDADAATITATWDYSCTWACVLVEVDYPYEPLVGMIPGLDDGIQARFTMLTQQQ